MECRRRRASVVAVWLLLVCSACEQSVLYAYQPIDWYVAQADVIATVEVLDRQPLVFEKGGKLNVCGHRYRAKVIEGFKGDDGQTLEFYGSEEGFAGLNQEYFVMVFERDLDSIQDDLPALSEGYSGLGRAAFACNLNGGPRFVKSAPLTLVPFDGDAADQLGGRWLRRDSSSDVLDVAVLLAGASQAVSLKGDLVEVVNWADVKSEIERLLAGASQVSAGLTRPALDEPT